MQVVAAAKATPVLEEFMPIQSKIEEDGGSKVEKDCRDKMNWMSSAQLWSDNSDNSNNNIKNKLVNDVKEVMKDPIPSTGTKEMKTPTVMRTIGTSILITEEEEIPEMGFSSFLLTESLWSPKLVPDPSWTPSGQLRWLNSVENFSKPARSGGTLKTGAEIEIALKTVSSGSSPLPNRFQRCCPSDLISLSQARRQYPLVLLPSQTDFSAAAPLISSLSLKLGDRAQQPTPRGGSPLEHHISPL